MKTVYKYFKSSNTGQMVSSQEFTETDITGIPIYYYDINGKGIGENLILKGFVPISERKFRKHQEAMRKEIDNEKS